MRSLVITISVYLALLNPSFSEVLTWECHFETRVDSEGTVKEEMLLIFKVDTVSQNAYMEGNAGILEVFLHVGEEAFSFSEQVKSGSIQTTTVTRDGLAVHSRNTVLFGEIVAAQHFGTCLFY